jgi:hypothetical protein
MATFVVKLDLWLNLPLVIFLVIIIYAICHVTLYDYVSRKKMSFITTTMKYN